MKLPEIFPPADLIDRVKGVKRRLRQRPWLGATRVGRLPGGIDHPVVAVNSPFASAGHELEWPTLLKFVGVCPYTRRL
jgi:hypothetical protein